MCVKRFLIDGSKTTNWPESRSPTQIPFTNLGFTVSLLIRNVVSQCPVEMPYARGNRSRGRIFGAQHSIFHCISVGCPELINKWPATHYLTNYPIPVVLQSGGKSSSFNMRTYEYTAATLFRASPGCVARHSIAPVSFSMV